MEDTKKRGRPAKLRRNRQQADDVIARMTETYTQVRPVEMKWLSKYWEPEDAEDILQDAWIVLSRQPEPPDGDWRPYIYQVIQSLSQNRARKLKRRNRLEHAEWAKIVRGFDLDTLPEVKLLKKSLDSESFFEDFDNFE